MIVVSNTSPITNLAAIGQFDLLRELYGSLVIAQSVWQELNAKGEVWPGRDEVARASWVEHRKAEHPALILALRRDLNEGEAETLALAVELGADLVLLDEKEGRHAAQRLGLQVIGVIGILLEAKSQGLIATIRPHLDALRHAAGFFVSDTLYDYALELAQEHSG
jgi:predicted nucleic acid-binding protein